MNDLKMDMKDAVELIPKIGGRLAFGGITLYRRPMAFALALLAEHSKSGFPRDLTIIAFTAGLETDLLIGAGLVKTIRSCYIGLEAFGLAPHFTSSAAAGEINIIEETEASLAFGLKASISGVGFMPSHAWTGTDLFTLRPDVKKVIDPYSGEELTAFPPITCDVAVIHALEADPQGNAIIGGNLGVDQELAMAAKSVIITTEKISPRLEKADIFGLTVDAVVEAPKGAWPSSCHPLYPLDGKATLKYIETAGKEEHKLLVAEWINYHNLNQLA